MMPGGSVHPFGRMTPARTARWSLPVIGRILNRVVVAPAGTSTWSIWMPNHGANLAGNQFYMTPKFDASLAGTYGVAVPVVDLHARLDYSWRDTVQVNVINDFNYQGPVGLLNGRIWLMSMGGTLETALFGTNITDKRYYDALYQSAAPFVLEAPGRSATFMLSARF